MILVIIFWHCQQKHTSNVEQILKLSNNREREQKQKRTKKNKNNSEIDQENRV